MSVSEKPIIVTAEDKAVFKSLIEKSHAVDPVVKKSHRKLYEELKVATVVELSEFPDKVVRLNSVVSIQTTFGRKDNIQLVLPSEADLSRGKLSVLSPMGAALIGYYEGDDVLWNLPKGEEKINIERVINKQ